MALKSHKKSSFYRVAEGIGGKPRAFIFLPVTSKENLVEDETRPLYTVGTQ
jgi:hypothetical protein